MADQAARAGIDGKNVIGAEELYLHPERAGRKIAILGGGLVGLELGVYMREKGHVITIIEVMDRLNTNRFSMHTLALNDMLARLAISVRLNTKALEIDGGGLAVEGPDESGTVKKYYIEADTIVYATGMKPLLEEGMALSQCAGEFYQIGDCVAPDCIMAATQPAHAIARDLGRL
jgi:pyruvate/2-oxoglutarate dehydrogenase complex dihydrolipoamide dehydrogenase (E3) component